MGALTYEPDTSENSQHADAISLDKLAAETGEVLEGEVGDVFAELLGLSGSSAGARPKVMLGVSANKKNLIHGQQELPKGYAHWMVKFASSSDTKDIGAIEYAYSLMARAAGLEMMPTYLFPAKKGAGYFGVERFDRSGDKRLHMHTVSGLLHADHRLPSLDYEQIMRATLALTRNVQELEKILRLAAFNVRLEGEITKEEFETKKNRLKDRQYELDQLILTYDKADDQFTKTLCALLTIASDSDKIWLGSTISEKRELLNFVFANLQLKGATLCYELRKPFDKMLNQADCIKWRKR